MTPIETRNAILQEALDFTVRLKPKARDEAIFNYCIGACRALYITGNIPKDVPGWLYLIAVRYGGRVKEAERLIREYDL